MKITITKPRERESIRATYKPIIQKSIDDYNKVWAAILFQEKEKEKKLKIIFLAYRECIN